ncbi:ubiquitin carboxyl-terminal hydrolase 49 isoform X1 [Gopherus flavomarginatus]|uniref:ubiquitin carboxyl-terminal hydrolase 49 isoform X1 n=1 Tax=Gopherus flavomarginatus TaxID=286002 RepID=UPI0021CC4C6A|nr:ubiquitin carboxyl-terminal hydrolase 49 isoform X1 [Gopherus flavomarginatus]XP_050811802.1 ubiquitin carboxyl-terminal hydrolase 49 isoform X1 [Gopherus flavomarginatus]XP_050811803.1 ubiquitin carboxyl-terminal hydrolase 49 isoform X1 [Gopherus flavomarginatus]XP_050811804.1 ubiquitin carboxyl-terminal hydrolase 49 isoform X1 [Gopherus flavomarginatus]XP_050811805.1 ubiquitin carboxyl-terminal hydrolase 49 isoform X1 [Gopherus flavomarginatus]XP_050811806.1 ubiquitin carboxyl-terminal hy
MDRCKHVGRLRLAQDHSILNPQKWHCKDCNTTESIWACLKCSHVACGRYIEEHALKHFEETKHPLAMEVNDLYVFCYLCEDYVLNDNPEGDLKLLRSSLSAIRSQKHDPSARSGRTLRSMALGEDVYSHQRTPQGQPQMLTALWHRRQSLLAKALRTWFDKSSRGRLKLEQKKQMEELERKKEAARQRRQEMKRRLLEELANTPPRKSARLLSHVHRENLIPRKFREMAASSPTSRRVQSSRFRQFYSIRRKPLMTPGVTGLRNLGNTCYMNSILQVLSHLQKFRECFLTLDLCETEELLAKTVNGKSRMSGKLANGSAANESGRNDKMGSYGRQSLPVGLNGGSSISRSLELIQPKEPSSKHISLCHELHTLFRVMWSGKWALVSPFAMLHSVWSLIPAFRGYDQQDAQEFLCELLDKVQQELESEGTKRRILIPFSQRKLTKQVLKVVNTIFHGQLLSQVTCITCNYKSNTIEPFWDLSLEFPERYHSIEKGIVPVNQTECMLTEMLAKFTETEALEGRIYACDQCNSKRRKSSPKPLVLSEAKKQLMIYRLPQVLRLHLKRFRWSGRNHREKIGVHVLFDQVLNMEPYCCRDSLSSLDKETFVYDLSAVVMHHGKGFGSGHYTAYCYNTEGGFWVHCNDSKLNVCSVEEVCKTQAYILFYTQRTVQGKAGISETQLQAQVPSRNSDEDRRLTFP